jgi:cytochrome c biogenesis protein CcmG/thiol:disulfide interchange protein DsbE
MTPATEHDDPADAQRGAPPTKAPRSLGRRLLAQWPYALFAAAVALWMVWGQGGGSGPPEGEPAPALQVPWTAGEAPFDLSAQRGHVVVLAFWATWCPACRAEGPILSRVERRLAGSGDQVVGVSIDNHPLPAVANAARGYGMTYPIALASRADAARFGVELLPTLVVVAPDGRVSASFAGTVSEDRLMEAVAQARRGG